MKYLLLVVILLNHEPLWASPLDDLINTSPFLSTNYLTRRRPLRDLSYYDFTCGHYECDVEPEDRNIGCDYYNDTECLNIVHRGCTHD